MSRRCPADLRPVGGWSALYRSTFEVEHDGATWTVDADYLDLGERLGLYRDGRLVDERSSPARFALPDGARVEAALSLLGMRRVHLVTPDGERLLVPTPGTGEAWRAGVARRHPRASAVVGALSWLVLVVGLLLQLPGWAARVAGWLGTTSPLPAVDLPGGVTTALGVAALVAGLDRALQVRHSRWLDD
ncbi:hypothetical protein [Pseudokineococcus lusitanus]|uniref:Uncharacterized protein n=1 Tax=Pseudokineococcus lusitanus TaxID=763993 RepID=A0A3N1GAD9_9ACTN|nr:hypothetical protein [Pseudokineococcus lusitanus]ROP27181.1 hypothetical protein EDC03_2705 [Pseudokineococcus lusitanus]